MSAEVLPTFSPDHSWVRPWMLSWQYHAQGRWWREYAIAVAVERAGEYPPVLFPLYADLTLHVYHGA